MHARSRGFVVLDMTMALTLVAAEIAMVVMASEQVNHGTRLMQTRAALSAAAADQLDAMQTHRSLVGEGRGITFHLLRMGTPTASPDLQWVKVTATEDSQHAAVVGLVPVQRKASR